MEKSIALVTYPQKEDRLSKDSQILLWRGKFAHTILA